ncbi:MAG: 30S ribosomal protein S6 [Rhodospirillales bacterium]|nr:30S ribosomal protein S6 [Rhodospirillales bacterium]
MPFYENVYIARPDISAAQVEALTEALTAIITENGGQVTKNEYWGLKNLAYRIKKNRKGHYSLMNIDAPAAALHELERNMRINEDILRHMSIRVDELDPEPSAMMQSRGARDDRGGRPSRDYGDGRPARAPDEAKAPAETVAVETVAAETGPKGDDA